jgi:hypothetical protein
VGAGSHLDAVGVVQADEDGAAVVAGDEPAVLLVECGQVLGPGVGALAGRDAERDEVETAQAGGALGVVPQGDLGAAVGGAEGDAAQLAVLDELDRHRQPEHTRVPLGAGTDVADRDLHVVDRGKVGHEPLLSLESALATHWSSLQ